MKTVLWIAVMCVMLMLDMGDPAQACSGYTPLTGPSLEYFVKAQVHRIDRVKQNYIIEVLESLKGEPPRFILVSTNPWLQIQFDERFYTHDCDFFRRSARIESDVIGYFSVQRNIDGSYKNLLRTQSAIAYVNSESSITVQKKVDAAGEDDWRNYADLTFENEADFNEAVLQFSDQSKTYIPPRPDPDSPFSPYPRLAPIYVETNTNEYYMVPIDDRMPVRIDPNWLYRAVYTAETDYCISDDCLHLSPDSSMLVQPIDVNTMIYKPAFWKCAEASAIACVTLEGQAVSFSKTSDALAIWNENTIDIYQIVSTSRSGYDRWLIPQKIVSAPLTASEGMDTRSLHGKAIWSDDGNVLVYADAAGLWWFDRYYDLAPRLVIPGDGQHIPLPLQLNGSGRFLAYSLDGTQQKWVSRDMVSGEELSNVLIAPSLREAVSLNRADPIALLRFPVYPHSFPQDHSWSFRWTSNQAQYRYVLQICDTQGIRCKIDICGIYGTSDGITCLPYYEDITLAAVDFDEFLGLVFTPVGESTIYVGYPFGWRIETNFAGSITKLEWMLPLFDFD
jgi:hypothetical protein